MRAFVVLASALVLTACDSDEHVIYPVVVKAAESGCPDTDTLRAQLNAMVGQTACVGAEGNLRTCEVQEIRAISSPSFGGSGGASSVAPGTPCSYTVHLTVDECDGTCFY